MLKINITEGKRMVDVENTIAEQCEGVEIYKLALAAHNVQMDIYKAQIAALVLQDELDQIAGRKEHPEGVGCVEHPLQEAFDAVIAQVTTGKGQRHGGGEQPFFEQPWFSTTQQVGIGFPLGQAMKKLGESSSKPDAESFETELLGAIAYAAMAYLANKKLAIKI